MLVLQGFLVNHIISFCILELNNRNKMNKVSTALIILVSFLYPISRIITMNVGIGFFRIILSFLVLLVMVKFINPKTSVIFFGFSFLIINILWLLSALIAVITLLVFNVNNELAQASVSFFWPLLTFSTLFALINHKKINLSYIDKLFKIQSIRRMIGAIMVLVMALYTFINVGASLEAAHEPTFSALIWALTFTVSLTIIFLTFFTIKHLNHEKRKQNELEQANIRLENEQLALQTQLRELDAVYTNLKKDFGSMTSNYHSYKYSIPVLLNMQRNLLEEINPLSANTTTEKLGRIQNYIDQVKTLSFEINHEFVADHVKSEIAILNIPQDNLQLISLLENLMTKAQSHEVYLSVHNYASTWDKLDVPDTVMLRLVSNLVDNAIKESCKIPKEDRGRIQLSFDDIDEHFSFKVSDYADEFNLDILCNLGTRKNSTNGTGDGYAELFADLSTARASFIIQEWKNNNRFSKEISIIFDGHEMKMIDSNYRHEQLKTHLTSTALEVLDIY